MPKLKQPEPDSLIAEKPGVRIYAKELQDEHPLYRGVQLITDEPFIANRRRGHLSFIVHLGRLRGGGDCWILEQHKPELRRWIESECALSFGPDYVQDTFGLTPEEYDALVEAENKKYKK